MILRNIIEKKGEIFISPFFVLFLL